MCLAIPGKVTEINTENMMRMSKVDFGGITREISLAYLPDVVVNEVLAATDDGGVDQVELVNTTGSLVDLGRWYVSNDDGDLLKWPFPVAEAHMR